MAPILSTTYDTASRLTGETRSGSQPYALAYAYDKAGNRTQQTRDGTTTVWSVDAANRLTTIRRQGVPTSVNVTVRGKTDDPSARIMVSGIGTWPNQVTKEWSQVISVGETTKEIAVSARDTLGNQRDQKIPVKVVDPTKREFTYDPNGNLTEEKKVATEESTRYAYDALNRLKGVSSGSDPGGSGGQTPSGFTALASYTYDGEGKRVSSTEGGVTTTYLYDGLLPVLERQSSPGHPELVEGSTVNVWGLSLGGGIGGLLTRVTPTGTFYPLYDGSGNILCWTDSAGQVVSTTTYTAFGEVVSTSSVRPELVEGLGFGFSTKSHSSATGLSYFGARYYSASLGRWLTPDPLGMVDGPNVYQYVGNNPMSFFDPWGFDYWIEGSVSGEPGPHQSINVGDPNGDYDSYGFGVNGNMNRKHGLEGEVYRDPMKGGPIESGFYCNTTPQEDAVIKAYLESQVGTKGPYNPWSTCRTWAQNTFLNLAQRGLGGSAKSPPRPNSVGQQSQSIPLVSSTITSSEPYGFPSGTTNSRMSHKKK